MNEAPFDLGGVPTGLRQSVQKWLEEHGDKPQIIEAVKSDPMIVASLPKVLACSQYVADTLSRHPALLRELAVEHRLQRPLAPSQIARIFSADLSRKMTQEEFERRLRLLRHRELIRIAWRDLSGVAKLEETLAELSSLADAAIDASLHWAMAALQAQYGDPTTMVDSGADFIVLGMGKLGGRELNFSSDIDLVFLFTDQGETVGPRSISNQEYFQLLAQQIISLLSKVTSEGFVYRVDVRLRPFGESGPLAVSLSALETYLAQHGRDWERYAYVKARVVNDWAGAEDFYQELLRPFIYRRYLDYGVFSALREMKALIEAEGKRKEYRNNVKLGPGGIREIEFIVQSFQLVRGGMVDELRDRELLSALPKLVRHGSLPEADARELQDAYRFLRLFENRLQAINDRQTHDLPNTELDRTRLAFAMEYPDWPQLESALKAHRHIVANHFHNTIFRTAEEPEATEKNIELARAWTAGVPREVFVAVLENLGFPESAAAAEQLDRFRACGTYLRLDETGRQRLDTLMPAIVVSAAEQSESLQGLVGALHVIEAIGRRSAYFALLNENPDALKRLVRLCATSQFLVRQIGAHPLLLDELLDQRIFLEAPTRGELKIDLDTRIAATSADDLEQRWDALRNFQQAATFRVAVADLSGTLPLMKVSDRLTDIAELILQAALDLSWFELTEKYGSPSCRDENGLRKVEFAIIAYGKLGGLELGYGSDLDLVFLNDSEGEIQHTDGEKRLDNPVFLARLTRRIIHILTMATTSGSLYEVDTRLRPSGKSGLLVSSFAAFDRYQLEDAWTWEHQALLRSRAVAGSPAMRQSFEKLRKNILTNYVRRDTLQKDVTDMRQRMRLELCKGTDELFDLKQDVGGVTDIEFIVQYLVLKEAYNHPELVHFPDNIRQLESLAQYDIMTADDKQVLADTYRTYRSRMHHLSLAGSSALVPRESVAELSMAVKDIWDRVFT